MFDAEGAYSPADFCAALIDALNRDPSMGDTCDITSVTEIGTRALRVTLETGEVFVISVAEEATAAIAAAEKTAR